MFLGGGFCALTVSRRGELVLGERRPRWKPLAAAITALPYVIWAGYRNNAFGDTTAYRRSFLAAPDTLSALAEYVGKATKDKGYSAFVVVFKALISNSDKIFFLIIALIQIACLVHIYRKYSENYWLSFYLFVASADYMTWMHNGMRQFIAAAIIFACMPLILKKKYWQAAAIILLVSTLHMTSLLVLPFIFIVQGKAWNKLTIFFLLLVTIAMVFLEKTTGYLEYFMDNSQYAAETDDLLRDDGANIIRVLFHSIPTIGSLVFYKRIRQLNDPLANLCINMSIASAGFYIVSYFTSGIYIGRIPIFFSLYNYLLYPWMLKKLFGRYARMATIALVGVYAMFFYYQMGVTWGLL